MNLTDICRIFHPTTSEYTFFSATHGTFSKTDNILRYKASLNKHKKIQITS
jgi:exonuclease III